MTTDTKHAQSSEVEVVHPSYQPSRAELEKDMRVEATFGEAVQALTQPTG